MTLPDKSSHSKDSDTEQKTESADDSEEKRSGQENEVKKGDGDADTNDPDLVCIICFYLHNIKSLE